MKTKELQAKSGFFRQVFLCAICCALLSLAFFGVSVSAAAESDGYIVENRNLIEEYLSDIGEEIASYTSKDTSEGGKISKDVASVINAYRKQLIDLQTHADVSVRSMKAEIDLAYTRSVGAGKLAWIYYFNTSKISAAASLSAIKSTFEDCLAAVDSSRSASVLSAEIGDLCADLNGSVYAEKIILLEREGDSPRCLGYIEKAVVSAAQTRDGELSAPQLFAIYSQTENELSLQRARDELYAELGDVFFIVRPGEDYSSNKKVALFLLTLENSRSIGEMNEAARLALRDILPSAQGLYSERFLSGINASASEITLRASEAGSVAHLVSLFEGYALSYKKAVSKDVIATELLGDGEDGELLAIEQSFNADGGVIDKCSLVSEVDTEVTRARYRKALYSAYKLSLKDLEIIMGSYDREAVSDRLKTSYEASVGSLEALSVKLNSFAENCNLLLDTALLDFESILNDAKAQRYLLDHKNIVTRPNDSIGLSDESALRSALIDYQRLEPDVRDILSGQIDIIVEKYKLCLSDKMYSLRKNDVLYKELCASIVKELKGLSSKSIDDFYNYCDLVFAKAQALCSVVDHYRTLCNTELYASYTEQERDLLSDECADGAKLLLAVDIYDPLEYEARIERVTKNTIIELERIDCSTCVRVAARGSLNPNVDRLVADARSLISLSSDEEEMRSIAGTSVFKINRLLTSDAIIAGCEKEKYLIENMKFLTSDEKALLISRIESLKKSFADSAALSENLPVLSFIWESFGADLAQVSSEALQKDLERAKESYSKLAQDDIDKMSGDVAALAHLSQKRKDEIISSTLAIKTKFFSELPSSQSAEDVSKLYASLSEQIGALKIAANAENLTNYKRVIKGKIDALMPPEGHYSAKSYKEVGRIFEGVEKRLAACLSISDCNSLLSQIKEEIAEIPNLLDDAKNEAVAALAAALKSCTDNASLYSAQSLALARSLYSEAVRSIAEYSEIGDIHLLNDELEQSLKVIRAVPQDVIYSAGAEQLLEAGAKYPQGYNFSVYGLWARIYAEGSISQGASLSVKQFDADEAQRIEDAVQKAAKNGSLIIYGSASEDRISLLKKCVVAMGLDVTLSKISPDAQGYSLQMLLPESLREENVLGLVFVDENGNAEYYPTQQRDMLVSLELSHLSKYYVVCEDTVNLAPLLIFLIILLVFEIVIFCFILFLRYYRKRKDNDMLHKDCFYGFAPFTAVAALRVKPSNAVSMSVLLAVAALALGCAIAFLAKAELSAAKKKKGVAGARPTRAKAPEALPEREVEALPSGEREALCEGVEIPVLCSGESGAGEDIEAYILKEEIPEEANEDFEESRTGARRAEINLDVIARKFKAGEVVTPEALKRKGLIGDRCDYVKILARGKLTKPLIVEAHDFSRAAEQMLIAIGGEAIRIE